MFRNKGEMTAFCWNNKNKLLLKKFKIIHKFCFNNKGNKALMFHKIMDTRKVLAQGSLMIEKVLHKIQEILMSHQIKS